MTASQYITYPPTSIPAVAATAGTQVSVSSVATKVFSKTTGVQSVIIQNQGTVPVTVSQTSGVTVGNGAILNACTTTADGTGGSITFANYCGDVYAISSGATVNVGVQAISAT
jgi:hypothetical protein